MMRISSARKRLTPAAMVFLILICSAFAVHAVCLDFDGSGQVDLSDAIFALQEVAGGRTPGAGADLSHCISVLKAIGGLTVNTGCNSCFGLLESDPAVCNGHGTCVDPDTCSCDAGYSGEQCQDVTTCFGKPYDHPEVCSGQGTCAAQDTCVCQSGFSGDQCEIGP